MRTKEQILERAIALTQRKGKLQGEFDSIRMRVESGSVPDNDPECLEGLRRINDELLEILKEMTALAQESKNLKNSLNSFDLIG